MDLDTRHPDDPDGMPDQPASRWSMWAEALVAVGVLVLGIVVLLETQDIRVARAYSKVGPRVIPTIVGWGLIAIGAWYLFDVLRGHTAEPAADAEDADPTLPADWRTLGGIGLALVLYAAIIEPAGYVIASALLFLISAWSMGSRRLARDVPIALILAIASYYAFSEWLSIRLPQGIWFN